MLSQSTLIAMVKGIRANRGKENEYIAGCLTDIRREVQSKNLKTKSDAVLKLAYLGMLGYDMNWATFPVVEVMSAPRYAVKRPGYLACMMCFGDGTDVGLLTTNLFKKDFSAKSQYECGMALNCLASICNPEISRVLLNDLVAILSSSRAYLRKKTVLCLFRVFVKHPPALREVFPKLKERLGDEDQGVLTGTVNTLLELARKNARNYLSLVPQLYHVLTNTTNNWLAIKLLKLFQLLMPLEPRLPAKMVGPMSNLLSTTKAQSVEFECIRCITRTMPAGTELVNTAIEKLQVFLDSSDRNLRYIALELFAEILGQAQFKDRAAEITGLHEKVLESVEEVDPSMRKFALILLDRIVTPASFVDTVKKLMEYTKTSSSPDEYLGTILRMGARERYALVEDFAWYLLVLAEIAKYKGTEHASELCSQFLDICVRVPQVRPYAVALASSILTSAGTATAGEATSGASAPEDGEGGSLDVAPDVVGACAWVIGEYHAAFEQPAEPAFAAAAKALLTSKSVRSLDAANQAQCIWAATKLYVGAATHAPGEVSQLQALLAQNLPDFVQSTHVDVSERAVLAHYLAVFFQDTPEKVAGAAGLLDEALKPVATGAQAAVPVPEGLGLDEPFFEEEVQAKASFVVERADPTDPYALAACYKDDLGFLAAKEEAAAPAPAPVPRDHDPKTSMFYLKQGASPEAAADGEAAAAPEGTASLDPLEQMKEKLKQTRTAGMKYEVMREDAAAPTSAPGVPRPPPAETSSASALWVPAEKEITELSGRLWAECYRDQHVALYSCSKSRSLRKQQLRVDLRCEWLGQNAGGAPVSDVALVLPAGVVAQEADESGRVVLVPGKLEERAPKSKVTLGLQPFVCPVGFRLACSVRYDVGGVAVDAGTTNISLSPTTCLMPAPMSEDAIQEYVGSHAEEFLSHQSAQAVNLGPCGETPEALQALVGRCAGICSFHGLQQSSSGARGHKFLLVAKAHATAPSSLQEPFPEGAIVLCLITAKPKEDSLEMRVIVKACRKDVCDEVLAHLAFVLGELAGGRLKAS